MLSALRFLWVFGVTSELTVTTRRRRPQTCDGDRGAAVFALLLLCFVFPLSLSLSLSLLSSYFLRPLDFVRWWWWWKRHSTQSVRSDGQTNSLIGLSDSIKKNQYVQMVCVFSIHIYIRTYWPVRHSWFAYYRFTVITKGISEYADRTKFSSCPRLVSPSRHCCCHGGKSVRRTLK